MKDYNGRTHGKGGQFTVETGKSGYARGTDAPGLERYGTLGDTVERVLLAGAYISFGRTADGGANLIRVLDGDEKLSTYCTTHAEVLEALEALRRRYTKTRAKITPIDKAASEKAQEAADGA